MKVDELIELDIDAVNGSVFPLAAGYGIIYNNSYRRKRAYIQRLDEHFHPVADPMPKVTGAEDPRVIFHRGAHRVWCCHGDGKGMGYGTLDLDHQHLRLRPLSLRNMQRREREKNWCPLVKEGRLYVVYSLYPELVILAVDEEGVHEPHLAEPSVYLHDWVSRNVDLEQVVHLGGGTNYVEYRGYNLAVFHVKYKNLVYDNYLVFLGDNFSVQRVVPVDYGEAIFAGARLQQLTRELHENGKAFSVPRYRQKLQRVTFSSGLFLANGFLHISVGVNDLTTVVARLGLDKIDSEIADISRPDSG